MLWLAQRKDSLHVRFGESKKSWNVLAREQIQQLSSFRLVLRHSLLLAFILAPRHLLQQT